jgi:hypothetical protein
MKTRGDFQQQKNRKIKRQKKNNNNEMLQAEYRRMRKRRQCDDAFDQQQQQQQQQQQHICNAKRQRRFQVHSDNAASHSSTMPLLLPQKPVLCAEKRAKRARRTFPVAADTWENYASPLLPEAPPPVHIDNVERIYDDGDDDDVNVVRIGSKKREREGGQPLESLMEWRKRDREYDDVGIADLQPRRKSQSVQRRNRALVSVSGNDSVSHMMPGNADRMYRMWLRRLKRDGVPLSHDAKVPPFARVSNPDRAVVLYSAPSPPGFDDDDFLQDDADEDLPAIVELPSSSDDDDSHCFFASSSSSSSSSSLMLDDE